MTSIATEVALRKYFTPDSFGLIPAYHRGRLEPYERRTLIEALIDFYENNKDRLHIELDNARGQREAAKGKI